MKSLLLAMALLAGINVQASTVDGYTLPILGNQTEENFTMNSVQTRTEYRTETVASTCWRTVADGYGIECREVPETICYNDRGGRPVCSTRFVRQCYNEIRYRQEAYTCYQTVSVPYEVFSHNVRANVNVKVSSVPGDIQATNNSCGINFLLDGNNFKSTANCSEFIILAKNTAQEERVGNTVIQTRALDLTLLDAQKIAAPTKNGISGMRLEGQTLIFKTGDLTKNPNFSLKLFVERRRFLKSDITLINRNLAPAEYSFEKTSEEGGLVRINLKQLLGGINSDKKHVIRVNMNVNLDTRSALNAKLPPLSADESITVNN